MRKKITFVKTNTKILFLFATSALFLFFTPCVGYTENVDQNQYYKINIDKETIQKGYTVTSFGDKIKLSLVPGILNEDTDVEVAILNEELDIPWKLNQISKFYQFEFKNKAAYDNHTPFYIQLSYEENSNDYKNVFFFDKNYNTWRPLPTKDFPEEKFVRSLIHLPYARIAVFSYPDVLTAGRASWYKYKGGNYAASPDFPKGSIIRVWNTENNKYVDVEINDFGPERNLFPDRVIDLDKIAFSKIASLGAGIIDIKIEPLQIYQDNNNNDDFFGISDLGMGKDPQITSKAAIAINEDTDEIIWSKNATTTLPLASLTKMVAVKVFLDTRPTLNQEVSYSTKDEEYNNQFCKPWESAKLKIAENETLTIENLVYTSLVASANNTIESLVRVSGLKREDFIKKMNDSVKEWGASSTYFVEPTGLSPDNVSSPLDYAIITKETLKNPIIQKASTMQNYKFTTINLNNYHNLNNTNQIIRTNKFNITGSKTGYLDEAGYCLMTRVKHLEDNIIVVTFGSESRDTSLKETEMLMNYGIRHVK